jgi:LPXTG-motif cell wall-anchored protein
MKRFAVAALAVALPLLSVATAHADTDSVTVTGVAWKDLNGDGIRQPSEPLLPGVSILWRGIETFTDKNGRYFVANIPTGSDGSVEIQAGHYGIEGGAFVLTRPHQGDSATDSDFDWDAAWAKVNQKPVNGIIDNVDVGYKPSTSDPSVVSITPDQAPGTAHVGDEITYTINTAVTDTPADFSVLVQFPTGVQASDRQLTGGTVVDLVGTAGVKVGFLRGAQLPGLKREFQVAAKVVRPTDGLVIATLTDLTGKDVNPNNNIKAALLKLAGAPTTTAPTTTAPTTTQPTTSAPKASPVALKTTNTAQLANTGADPTWPLIAGLVLLAGGVGTVLFARRRRTN